MAIIKKRKVIREEEEEDNFGEQPEELGFAGEEDDIEEEGYEDEFEDESEDESEEKLEDDPDEEVEGAGENEEDGLTFGQILKRKEKEARRKKKAAATADSAQDTHRRPTEAAPRPRPTSSNAIKRPSRVDKDAPEETTSRFPVKFNRDFLSQYRAKGAGLQLPPQTLTDELRTERNYAFLDEYRDKEIADLREAIAAARRTAKAARRKMEHHDRRKARKELNESRAEAAEAEVAELRNKLSALESQKRALENKRKERAVQEAHQKRERELVKQGKKTYYLKRSQPKKQLLVDKFASMTERQAENVMERRRKKAAMRERRGQPLARRGAE